MVQVGLRHGADMSQGNQLYSCVIQLPLLNGRKMAQCDRFLAERQGVNNMALGRNTILSAAVLIAASIGLSGCVYDVGSGPIKVLA